MRWVYPCFAAMACLGTSSDVRANLIANESFESPSIGPNNFVVFNAPISGGWFNPTGNGNGIEIQSNSILGPGNVAHTGTQYAELSPNFPSSLSQTISTVAGQRYLLTFWYANRPGTGTDTGSVTFGATTVPLSAGPTSLVTWIPFSQVFTATGPTTTVTFKAISPNAGVGLLLDDVAVQPIPEPATLIAFGLMALGGAGYVRRRKVAATA